MMYHPFGVAGTHHKMDASIYSRQFFNDWPRNGRKNGDHPYNGYKECAFHCSKAQNSFCKEEDTVAVSVTDEVEEFVIYLDNIWLTHVGVQRMTEQALQISEENTSEGLLGAMIEAKVTSFLETANQKAS